MWQFPAQFIINPVCAAHGRFLKDSVQVCSNIWMRVIDAFCGAGGWSAGAVAAGCTPVIGIDSDAVPLKLWATNCTAGRAVCAIIGADVVDWPEAAPGVHLHLSPPCTSLSKARAGSASASSVATALDAVSWCVQLVLDKGYASWSLENVATPAVVACVRPGEVHAVLRGLFAPVLGIGDPDARALLALCVCVRSLPSHRSRDKILVMVSLSVSQTTLTEFSYL